MFSLIKSDANPPIQNLSSSSKSSFKTNLYKSKHYKKKPRDQP